MSKRAGASKRREILTRLASIKRKVGTLQAWWNVSSTVYIPRDQQTDDRWRRPREHHEYPENDVKYWAGTVQEVDWLIGELTELKGMAISEYWNLRERQEEQ